MIIGLIRAFRNIRVISGGRAAHMVEGIESNSWYPMANCLRIIDEVCKRDIDYGPILFKAGCAVSEDWYENGGGRTALNSGVEFLRMQGRNGGYGTVHRGKAEEIGFMDLLELDEAGGCGVLVAVTPYPREFERGILYGGMLMYGDVEYVGVESVEEPYRGHLTRKTLRVRFARKANPALSGRLDDLLAGLMPAVPVDAPADLVQAMAWRLKGSEERHRVETAFHRQSSLLLDSVTEELDASRRSKDRLFAAASHDLRQPIQAMGLFLDALLSARDDEERGKRIGSMRIALNALRELLDTLLDLAKLDSGTVVPTPTTMVASDLFTELDATFSPQALAQGLRLKLHFPAQPVTLSTDRRLLLCVLNNLVSNALKNTAHGGVLIALRQRGGSLAFQIWDSGTGIAPEHLERIFDEYYQVGNPERDRAKGLGLGLAIARRICALLDLRLSCRSRPGQGSMFEVRLPVHAVAAGMPARRPSVDATPLDLCAFHGKRFVLVEDDPLVSSALRDSLSIHGIEVRAYRDGVHALADPDIRDVDAFIVDHQLAGAMNGLEFLQAASELRGRPVTGVIISGNTSQDFVGSARELHWPLLFKPVDTQGILRTLVS